MQFSYLEYYRLVFVASTLFLRAAAILMMASGSLKGVLIYPGDRLKPELQTACFLGVYGVVVHALVCLFGFWRINQHALKPELQTPKCWEIRRS